MSVSTGSFTTSCGSSLPPGSECDLLLTGGGTGTVTATMGTGTQTAPFPAFTTPGDSLVFSPKELDFGLVTSGSTTPTAIFTVSNLGSAVQTFSSAPDVGLKATSPFSQASSDCPTSGVAMTKQLAAGATCHITLTFTPYAAASNDGPVTGLWSIGSRDVELTAHSQAAALSVSSSTVEFGTQFAGGLRLPRYLYLSNASSTPLPHSALALPASSPFTIIDRCPAELLPNTVCQIRIDYSAATAPSSDSAVLSLDAGLSVALAGKTLPQPGVTGASVNPSLAVSPLAITFADPVVVTSTSSTTATVGITNSGASAFSLSLALSGDFSDSTSCGATLAAGATCAVAITFAPSQPGTRAGLLAITAGAGTSPLYVTLSGIGTALLAAGSSAIDLGSTLVGEPVTQFLKLSQPFTSLAITATGPFSAVLVEDTGFGYGNPPAASFASSLTGACHTCFLGIRFLPTTASSQSGTLTLASSQLGATQTVALTGTATPTSGLLLSPSVQNFGNIPLHSSSGTSLFTLTNLLATQASASLGSPSVSGDFSLAAAASPAPCPVTLPFGASCTLEHFSCGCSAG